MGNTEHRIPDEVAPEVLELAAQYYANAEQSYSVSDLVAAGNEVQIPEKFIHQAIQDVHQRQRQAEAQQKRQRQRSHRIMQAGAGLLLVIVLWSGWTYNRISQSKSQVDARWAQVENQLQRRADLLPNLVAVTQASAQQEQNLIEMLESARKGYLQATTPEEKALAIQEINRVIEDFYTYAASNPQLQSSQTFINLQYEIAGTENRVAVERQRYNQAVQSYNQKIQAFPNLVIAQVFGFQAQEFFPS